MFARIEEKIKEAIPDAEVQILDPRNDGVHLEAVVVARTFENLTMIQQHRLVMEALKELFETGLHALALKTYTPEEWHAGPN